MNQALLQVKGLKKSFNGIEVLHSVDFSAEAGKVTALAGENGAGKSTLMKILMGEYQADGGEVLLEGKKVAFSSPHQALKNGISMIFQEPMTSLNPVYTIGNQLTEVLRAHHKNMTKQEAWKRGVDALAAVGIPDPEARMKNYPFEMSGGMRQRAMIAISVACNSKLIVADEPTTALDVTTQAQVMELLLSLVEKNGTSIIVVTHNLGLVTRYADRIYVMYAGRIVESGTTEMLLTNPRHPYTLGLLASVPKLDSDRDEKLVPIEGTPPNLANIPEYCSFYPRCPYACEECKAKEAPALRPIAEEGHFMACHLDVKGGEENG